MRGGIINKMACGNDFDYDKAKSIVLYLIYKSPRITATRLQKFYYLAELRSIEKYGKRMSDVNFCSYYYGPYSPDISAVADGLDQGEIKISEFVKDDHIGRFHQPAMHKVMVNINKTEIEILDEILLEFKTKKNEYVLKEAKATEPYIWAEFGDPIDFERYTALCDCLHRDPVIKGKIDYNRSHPGRVYETVDDLIRSLD